MTEPDYYRNHQRLQEAQAREYQLQEELREANEQWENWQ